MSIVLHFDLKLSTMTLKSPVQASRCDCVSGLLRNCNSILVSVLCSGPSSSEPSNNRLYITSGKVSKENNRRVTETLLSCQ